ncbi:helix-turn-helix domain-containing protein [Methylobacterium nonmethylotrophicum]|uniref:XRE family transcriptional regulator n=1 Tax=Methylobacterium nonmethylotrophicum TaxID=1141884 RepID=A0A4Z0NQC1_9HYPH|nr:helix-turn-helix transcriptional regulator [Methylobacterium nonmethylotrophicum]TGD99104.1 XRE family transcriptional regulator [Methylobacterium nonmethylotrophicum]
MSTFIPSPISVADQDDLRADARAEMFFALRKAFGERSKQCGIKAKDLSDILGKDKSYVSRVLNGSNGSIDFETLYVFMNALGYHLPLDPVSFERLHAKKSNIDVKPKYYNGDTNIKSNLYAIRFSNINIDDSTPSVMSTRRPKIKKVQPASENSNAS